MEQERVHLVINMLVNFLMDNFMGRERLCIRAENMLGNIKITKDMDKEHILMLTEIITSVNGKTINIMEMEYIHIQMATNTLVNGKKKNIIHQII